MEDRPEVVEAPSFELPIHEAIFWRGVFINSYAAFEFGLSEFLLRLTHNEHYRQLGTEVPFTWEGKLKRLRQVLNSPGPVALYATELRGIVRPLTYLEKPRNLLVHGLMSLGDDAPDALRFRQIGHRKGNRQVQSIQVTTTVADFAHVASGLGPRVAAFLRLIGWIFHDAAIHEIGKSEPMEIELAEFDL